MEEETPKLLIVDDEHNTREAMARYLGKRFRVTTAADGAAALDELEKHRFDLVLTDLRMPHCDGMKVLEAARRLPDPPSCILLTAYGSIEDAVTAVKLGAFDFVTKPVKLDKLEEVIGAALKDRAAKREAASPGPEPMTTALALTAQPRGRGRKELPRDLVLPHPGTPDDRMSLVRQAVGLR